MSEGVSERILTPVNNHKQGPAMYDTKRRTREGRRYSSRQRGFTLQELVVSLAIGGGVTAGATGLYTVVQEAKLSAATNEIVAHMNLARSEAITRGYEVAMCANDNAECKTRNGETSWQDGYRIYANTDGDNVLDDDEPILRVHDGHGADITVRSNRGGKLTFKPEGVSPGSTITVAVCGARKEQARYVIVQNGGRARVARQSNSNVRCT